MKYLLNAKLFIQGNASENIVCETATILFRGRWVKIFRDTIQCSMMYSHWWSNSHLAQQNGGMIVVIKMFLLNQVIYCMSVLLIYSLNNRLRVGVYSLSTLIPRQSGQNSADHIFKCVFVKETNGVSPQLSLTFVAELPIHNKLILVQAMAIHYLNQWCLSLLTHICVTWPWRVTSTDLPLHEISIP